MKSKKDLIEELNQSLQHAGTLTVLHTNAIASKIGLSATEFESMDVITRYQPMSAGVLASKCGLTTGAITGIVDRLEREGLVRRVRDPHDRRRVFLEPLEDKDKSQIVHAAYRPMCRAFEQVVEKYNADEIALFIKVHNEMNEAVEGIITELRQEK